MESIKSCYRCGQAKPLTAFTGRIDDRHYAMCRDCVSEILRASAGGKQRLPHSATHRTCYLCRRQLSVERFQRRSTGTYFSACKDCNRHVFAARRRARLMGAEGSYTSLEFAALVDRHDCCPRCKRSWEEITIVTGKRSVITADHIIPLSKGGSNAIENIQPLCFSCNSQKGAKIEPE